MKNYSKIAKHLGELVPEIRSRAQLKKEGKACTKYQGLSVRKTCACGSTMLYLKIKLPLLEDPSRANKPSLVFAWANISHVPFLLNVWRWECCLAYGSSLWCPPLPRPGLRTWDLCYVRKTHGQRSSQLFAKWSLSAGEI